MHEPAKTGISVMKDLVELWLALITIIDVCNSLLPGQSNDTNIPANLPVGKSDCAPRTFLSEGKIYSSRIIGHDFPLRNFGNPSVNKYNRYCWLTRGHFVLALTEPQVDISRVMNEPITSIPKDKTKNVSTWGWCGYAERRKEFVSQQTLYGVQHIHINLTLIHSSFSRYADAD